MVFKMVYCDEFEPQKIELYRDVCHRFARAIDCYSVTWRKKLKIHLILHLPDSMLRFGPASSFNTERCESYNSVIRSRNVYSNRQAPSNILLLLLLYKKVLDLPFPAVATIHLKGLIFLETELIVKLNFLLADVCSARTKAPLASVPITLEGKTMSLEEIDAKFTVLLPHGISNLTPVQWGRATVGKNGQLINVQDYIEYNSQASTSVGLETGLFIGSFHTEQATFCLVRYLEPVLSGTEPVLNEWGCSLLTLTNVIRCIASTLVSCAVSVVHQCDNQCVLAEQETTSRIERLRKVGSGYKTSVKVQGQTYQDSRLSCVRSRSHAQRSETASSIELLSDEDHRRHQEGNSRIRCSKVPHQEWTKLYSLIVQEASHPLVPICIQTTHSAGPLCARDVVDVAENN
ncbi:hypothetical protein EMCRGX_G015105 [Ephydatia muelleri]